MFTVTGASRTCTLGPGFESAPYFTIEPKTHRMRLFTAIDPPPDVREQYARVQNPEGLGARWSPPSQFHVTVRFIGNANRDQKARYREALAGVDSPTVECVPYGLDVLPSRRNPSVVIVGLERTESLMALYRAVSDALEGEGLEPEDRTYRPHVTLARVNDVSAAEVHEFLDTHTPSLDSFEAGELHLYQSTLTQEGAIHEREKTYALGAR